MQIRLCKSPAILRLKNGRTSYYPSSLHNGFAVIAGGAAPARLLPMRAYSYLYESGSGESDGFANSFFSSELIGTLRFRFFGGIFCVNHLS